jgi:hypothetical protein
MSVDLHTISQATLHFLPMVDSVPAHRKALQRLSIWAIARADRQQAMLVWTGMADRVTLVSKTWPVWVSRQDF